MRRGERILLGAVFLLALLPFVSVAFPPSIDLPQHLAQIRLLDSALHTPGSPYVVQWWAPHSLVYAVMGILWAVLPPLAAGRALLFVLAAGWIAAIAWLAGRRAKPIEAVAFATVLAFNLSIYWGFLNFLVGAPFFALLIATYSNRGLRERRSFSIKLLLLALALAASHVLWFAVGGVCIGLELMAERPRRKTVVQVMAAFLPVGILAILWVLKLRSLRADAGFDMAPYWATMPWERLHPGQLVGAALGGLRGPIEPLFLGAILVWIVAGIATNLREWRREIDRPLLRASGILFGLYLFAPEKYFNTLCFNTRWLPYAVTLAVLALPAPRFHLTLRKVLAFAVLMLFMTGTTLAWRSFDRDEMSGLKIALAKLPDGPRVLGLSFLAESSIVVGRPFIQTMAYAQVLHGGALNFSFAEHGSSIVRFRSTQPRKWTPNLPWSPWRVRDTDLAWFDYALINAPNPLHLQLAQRRDLSPITYEGRWRLYAIRADQPSP